MQAPESFPGLEEAMEAAFGDVEHPKVPQRAPEPASRTGRFPLFHKWKFLPMLTTTILMEN